jgi:GNAT superfamily N-acetyltransferase
MTIRCDIAPVDQIVDLRHRILRADLPRESAMFEGDDEPTTGHFAAWQDAVVVGCVSIMRRALDDQPGWQLRGMAVDADLRRAGVGARLLQMAIDHIRSHGAPTILWCNAREVAIAFYQRQGLSIISPRFEIPTAGPHYKMLLRIN